MGIQYRPEIDGLRAIAVLAVVLFHAGIGSAGYVGVDVFFVISGYLITSLLLAEHANTGRIDLLAFYARRVRRIFPAATVVILAVLCFSWLLPDVQAPQDAAKSAGAALLFVANAFFEFTTGGYWDGASDEMPLMHLWSLSVEEQFYFLWPALLLFTRSRKVFAGLALASFALAEYWMAANPEAAFFRMPARFWELAVGGLIAAAPQLRLPAWTGMVGVIATLGACIHPFAHFPASGALPAVLSASLVLTSVHGGGTNRFLASSTMVGIGKVSYSFYLWHWPLLAFYRANGGLEPAVVWALCALSLLLAALSYRFVEQPFRGMRLPSGRTVALGASASVVLALSACAYGLHEPALPAGNTKEALAARAQRDHLSRKCEYHDGDRLPKCESFGADAMFWGDSMALSWSAGRPDSAVFSFPGCAPVLGRKGRRGCKEFNDQVAQHLTGDTLYIVAQWVIYGGFDLTPTFQATRGFKRVVVIGPTPKMQATAAGCILGQTQCGMMRAAFDAEAKPILSRLRAQARPFPNVELWDVSNAFCTTDCPVVLGEVALYHDEKHPSVTQVRRVFSQMRQ